MSQRIIYTNDILENILIELTFEYLKNYETLIYYW